MAVTQPRRRRVKRTQRATGLFIGGVLVIIGGIRARREVRFSHRAESVAHSVRDGLSSDAADFVRLLGEPEFFKIASWQRGSVSRQLFWRHSVGRYRCGSTPVAAPTPRVPGAEARRRQVGAQPARAARAAREGRLGAQRDPAAVRQAPRAGRLARRRLGALRVLEVHKQVARAGARVLPPAATTRPMAPARRDSNVAAAARSARRVVRARPPAPPTASAPIPPEHPA